MTTDVKEFVINLSNVKVEWATYDQLHADLSAGGARGTIEALPCMNDQRVIIIIESSKQMTASVDALLKAKYGSCTCIWHKGSRSGRSYPATNQREL